MSARNAFNSADLDTAAAIAADILTSAPDNLDAIELKALVEIERGDHAAAEASLRSAIAQAPKRRWPYADLARLLLKLGRTPEAESVARAALGADSRNADAHAMLGSMLAGRQLLMPATLHFEQAIALVGRHPQLMLGLGRALMLQGQTDRARSLFEEASATDPAAIEPLASLAELEERAGRFEAALCLLDRAEDIAVAAGTDVNLQRSILLERMGKIEDALRLLEGETGLSGAAHLQRGRLRDRLGRHRDAWSDWTAGKAMLAETAGRRYHAGEVEQKAEALARFFTAEQFAALPRAPMRNDVPQPIFILGFPRSGTTLTEQIVANHSTIRAGGELPFAADLRDYAVSMAGGEQAFPPGLRNMTAGDAVQLRDFYLDRAEQCGLTAPGAEYFTDKMPLNEMWLPLLRIAFPLSPIILVRRHPLDVLTSVMSHDMTHGFYCGYSLSDSARHLTLVDRLMARYEISGIGPIHDLRYESLVADQAGETDRLMEMIGLPLEPAQLRFHERGVVSPTPSYAQVREPLNDRSIGRWRNYSDELASVRDIVSEAMRRGGYDD